MDSLPVSDHGSQGLGEEWIQSLLDKDYQRLAAICRPDVLSRTMTPKRFDTLESASDLIQKVEGWFRDSSSIQKEQDRVEMVGEKLAIFYRLRVNKAGEPYTIEQQIYCTLREERIEQLNLLCSGFQPLQAPVEQPIPQAVGSVAASARSTAQEAQATPFLHADAFLEVGVATQRESTCAILTPTIKRKLDEMSSGQVLEVHVNDPSAREDIEAWCRLSGNRLLAMDPAAGQALHFYLMKK